MATTGEPSDRAGQRGYALVVTLFLLASATTVGYLITENGLTARKSSHAASLSIGAAQRAARATWIMADQLPDPNSPAISDVAIDGRPLIVAATRESGRIDLNGLSGKALADAVESLGFDARRAARTAEVITAWRGFDTAASNQVEDGRKALWSLDDLDGMDLDADIRDCLKSWGSAHARGPFSGAVSSRDLPSGNLDDHTVRIIVGSLIRIVALDQTTQKRFRSIFLYRGPHAASDKPRPPWVILEWLRPAASESCRTAPS